MDGFFKWATPVNVVGALGAAIAGLEQQADDNDPNMLFAVAGALLVAALISGVCWYFTRGGDPLKRNVHIKAYGYPQVPFSRDWRHVNIDPATHRYRSVAPSVTVLFSSDAEQDYLLSDIYIEIYRRRSWGRLFRRPKIYRLDPTVVAGRPPTNPTMSSRVNWTIKPHAAEKRWDVEFGDQWPLADGPKWMNNIVDYRLVTEFSGGHRRVIWIDPPTTGPLPEPEEGEGAGRERADAAIRELRTFINGGQGILEQCKGGSKAQANEVLASFDDWSARCIEYLSGDSLLGAEYEIRFEDEQDASLPAGSQYAGGAMQQIALQIASRTGHMHDFVKELSPR